MRGCEREGGRYANAEGSVSGRRRIKALKRRTEDNLPMEGVPASDKGECEFGIRRWMEVKW